MVLRSAKCAPGSSRCAATMGLLTEACVAIDGSKFKAREQPRQELYARENGPAPGADQGERRAVSAAARHCRPAGAVGGASRPRRAA